MKREYRTLLEYIWKPGVNEWIPKKYLLLSYVGNVDGPNPIEETWKVIKDILLEKAPPKYKIFRNQSNTRYENLFMEEIIKISLNIVNNDLMNA